MWSAGMGMHEWLSDVFGGASRPAPVERSEHERPPTTLLEPPGDAPGFMPDNECECWWIPDRDAVIPAPAPAANDRLVDRDLHDQLVRTLDDPGQDLPRLPQIAQRALVLLHDPYIEFKELAELLAQDAATAARVLRAANSAAYRGINGVVRLDAACARLGSRTLRSLILAVSAKGLLIRIGGPDRSRGEELWQRALTSGIVLEQFADPSKISPDETLMIGLLHDIGMLGVLKILNEHQQTHGQSIPRPEYDRLCDDWHEHLGLRLADAWNLPSPLPEIIGSHHRQPRDDDPLEYHRSLVQFADVVCSMLGYAPYVPYDFFELPCVGRLGLEDEPATRERLAALPDAIASQVEAW